MDAMEWFVDVDTTAGDVPFPETIRSWYWGHTHLGEWSLVFFNGVVADGERFADACVANAGRVIVVDCSPKSICVTEITVFDL